MVLRIITELASEVGTAANAADPLVVLSFDIKRAYPSVPREAAFQVFSKAFGLPDTLIAVIRSLHNHTSFFIRTRQGDSEPFTSSKGFREGCPSSPGLYNMFHTIPVLQLVAAATQLDPPAGVQLGAKHARKLNQRIRNIPRQWGASGLYHTFRMCILLFADDTKALCRQSSYQRVEALVESILQQWGETLHPSKTERLLLHPDGGPD